MTQLAFITGIVLGFLMGALGTWVTLGRAPEERDEAREDLRKLRLDLHTEGIDPDRVDRGQEVVPTEAEFEGLLARIREQNPGAAKVFEQGDGIKMAEAFRNDPRFRFTRDDQGNLMVGLREG
jgi:hypothetical protein